MDLNTQTIHDIIHPTAAFPGKHFRDDEGPEAPADGEASAQTNPAWETSQLNPKNRIDSLEPLDRPLFRIDGCAGLGTQYYIVPLFAEAVSPMRIDVFIPEESAQSPMLRRLLDLDVAFNVKDAARVRRLGIASYIIRALQLWASRLPDLASTWNSLPFGSRVVLERLSLHVRDTKISLAPTYYLERQLLSLPALCQLWGRPCDFGGSGESLPPTVDISQLAIVAQLHDSVALVRFPYNKAEPHKLWILKALTSNTKYIYHELRILLDMESHPCIISRPGHLVTKVCHFGAKVAVVGFTLPYHSRGSVRDILPRLRLDGDLRLADQLRWAIQLASATMHVREKANTYYPDLRLDNVVMAEDTEAADPRDGGELKVGIDSSADKDDLAKTKMVMVDFEQRGVWCEFSAPEVNVLDYILVLAKDEDIPDNVSDHYGAILDGLLPEWRELDGKQTYTGARQGYNVPWLILLPEEQEAAMVYMLGRVLWCIFEGMSAPQRAAVWQSYRWEPDIEFPTYRDTPRALRDLIERCTRGRRPVLSSVIARDGNRLVLRRGKEGRVLHRSRNNAEGTGRDASEEDEIRRVAKEWWSTELNHAEAFLAKRLTNQANGVWGGNYYDRPTLREVLAELEAFRAEASL